MLVSYMIATKNRKEELLKTLESCFSQDYPHKEVHVVDDGSTDGTSEMIRARFPETVLTRNDTSLGSIASRNQIFARAKGDVLIGFDDDSRFMNRDATNRIIARLKKEDDLGLVRFQDIGPEYPERISIGSDRLKGEWHVSSFACSNYALKREVLQKTGLFPEFFWHAYEEPDLAIRVWDAGYRCLQWNEILVWHEFSAINRNERRTHFFHARNELLSNWMRTPWPYVLPLTCWRMLSQLRYSFRRGWWTVEPVVWWAALRMLPLALRNRQPVRSETFRRCLALNRGYVTSAQDAWSAGR